MTTVNAITRFAYEEHAALVPLFTCTLLVRETKTNARAKSNRRMKPTKSTDAANTHAHTHTHTHTHSNKKKKNEARKKKNRERLWGPLRRVGASFELPSASRDIVASISDAASVVKMFLFDW